MTVLQRKSHNQVLEAFNKADIVIDQLLFGYAMSALEAMAMGKPTISGVTDNRMYDIFREQSYLNECPIVFAGPENLAGCSSIMRVVKSSFR